MEPLSQPFIPCLTTHFKAADELTSDVVKAIWHNTDSRKAAAKSWKQGHAVICGILALKAYPEFKVDRKVLTKAEAAAFDLIAERHLGTFIIRTSGKNRYRVSDKFVPITFVTDTSRGTLPFRVSGYGVNYTTPYGIPSVDAVKLINGSWALPCYVKDFGTAIEMTLQGQELPSRFEVLPEIDLSDRAVELVSGYTQFLDNQMNKRGLLAVRIRDNRDPNTITIAAAHTVAKDLGNWLMNLSFHWIKDNGLKHIIPPVHVWMPKEERWDIQAGIPYQQRLEQGTS